MAAIDFFCAPDDRHRVILLVDLLEKAGQSVALRTEPVDEPTRPCLVACTRRAFRESWICDLFTRARQVVALRLDDTPLPGPAAEIIDMQAWPARSADRHVGALVEWLEGGAVPAGPSGAALAGTASGGTGAAARRQRPDRPVMQRVRARLAETNLAGLLMLVGVLGAAALLGAIEPGQRMARPDSAAPPPPSAGARVAAIGAAGEGDGATGVPSSRPGARLGGMAAEEALPAGHPVAVPSVGPLHHLCDVRALAAAQAWSAVLLWTAAAPPFDRACGGPA
ncbi:MAG TPA: hypothetical protein VF210_19955 [Pseudomonadales bacterium]